MPGTKLGQLSHGLSQVKTSSRGSFVQDLALYGPGTKVRLLFLYSWQIEKIVGDLLISSATLGPRQIDKHLSHLAGPSGGCKLNRLYAWRRMRPVLLLSRVVFNTGCIFVCFTTRGHNNQIRSSH